MQATNRNMQAKQQLADCFNGNVPADLERAFTAASIILQGKAWAYFNVLMNLSLVWSHQCPTAGTDGVHIYINPGFFLSLPNDQQRAFLLAHEVGHVILRHPMRGEFYQRRGFHSMKDGKPVGWNFKDYNKAADYVINADLLAHGFEAIECGLYDNRFNRDHLVDHVYLTIHEDAPEQEPEQGEGAGEGQSSDADGDSDGSDQDGDDAATGDESGASDSSPQDSGEESGPGEESNDSPESGEDAGPDASPHEGHDVHYRPQYEGTPEEQEAAEQQDRDEVQRIVDNALDALQAALDAGESHTPASESVGSAGIRHVGDGNASSVNWQAELIEYVTRDGRGGDLTWSKIDRRKFVNYGIVAPVETGTLERIAFIIDISGSVCRMALRKAMIEVAYTIDLMQPTCGCLVLFTNSQVVDYHEVMSGQELLDLHVPNYGGTRMYKALDWMDEHGMDADVVICFTDGCMADFDWQRMADADTLMVLDSQPTSWIKDAADASGARVIVVDDVQLAA